MGKTILPSPPEDCNLVTLLGATSIAMSKYSCQRIKDELANKDPLKEQRGISQCSVVLCPRMYLFDVGTMDERLEHFDVVDGPFALGRAIQVPNQRKNVHEYVIKYNDVHDNIDGWVTHLPKTFFVQECLKEAVNRADSYIWRMSEKKEKNY